MPKRVAIVGAGSSGLTAVRHALLYDFDPVVFEKEGNFGGIMRYSAFTEKRTVSHNTVIHYSRHMSAFSDFPPNESSSDFMHHSEVLEYLKKYAENFQLVSHIRFNTEVVQVRRSESYNHSGVWEVEYENKDGSRNTELFDAILVCTGMHRDPWRPPLYRQEKYFKIFGYSCENKQKMHETVFPGRVIHACNYKQPKSDYSSKTVVVVGCGNSAVEIACYLAPIAKQVYLCIRRGNWLLDKTDKDGRPWDVNFNSRFHALGRKIVPKYIRNFLWELDAQKVLINSQEESKPQHRFFSTNFTFSADLPLNIENGRIIIKPNLLSFSENGVEFDDHSTVDQVDEVIFCTGYEFSFPFVEQGELVRTRNNDFHLFNHMYLPDLAPHHTLAVIGHVQPRGSLIPVAEMQCRYFFHALSGHMQLPSPFQMKVQLEERRCDMSLDYLKTRRHTQIEDYVEFMDQLAVAIGAKPNILSILTSDLRLALKSFFGPCVPYQYRLVGPHTWTGARKAIEDASSGSALLKSDYVQIMKYTAIWLFLLWLLSIMW